MASVLNSTPNQTQAKVAQGLSNGTEAKGTYTQLLVPAVAEDPEVKLAREIQQAAIVDGLWVIAFPYGANVRRTRDDKESLQLLQGQGGCVTVVPANGTAFLRSRATTTLVWMPQPELSTSEQIVGKWALPTRRTRDEEGNDIPVPGAQPEGIHKLLLASLTSRYRAAMKELAAIIADDEASDYIKEQAMNQMKENPKPSLKDVWEVELRMDLPQSNDHIAALKEQALNDRNGLAVREGSAKMTRMMILAVEVGVRNGFNFQVKRVLADAYQTVITVPSGEKEVVSFHDILLALDAEEKEAEAKALEPKSAEEVNQARLEAALQCFGKVGAIVQAHSPEGANAQKKNLRREIALLASEFKMTAKELEAKLVALGTKGGTCKGGFSLGLTILKEQRAANPGGNSEQWLTYQAKVKVTTEAETAVVEPTKAEYDGSGITQEEIDGAPGAWTPPTKAEYDGSGITQEEIDGAPGAWTPPTKEELSEAEQAKKVEEGIKNALKTRNRTI